MAQVWPAALQDYVNEESFSHAIGNTTVRTEMDIGPAKVRRRMTRSVDIFDVTITIDVDDYDTVYEFYDTTLNGGVEQFTFAHPFTGVDTNFRMTQEPTFAPMGGREFTVKMRWEAMP